MVMRGESNPVGGAGAGGPGVFESLVGIFLDPARTFRKISQQPVWLIPCLGLVLISMGSSYLIVEGIGFENMVRRSIDQGPFSAGMSREEKEEAIEQALDSSAAKYMTFIGPVLSPLVLLLAAGILTLVLMILGHSPGFARPFAVTVHAWWAYSVIVHTLGLCVLHLSQDRSMLDPQNLLHSHLGVLVDQVESPVLFTLAASFDLVTFYNLFLLALGLSVICGRRAGFGTGLGAVIVLWALWGIVKMGFAILMS